MKRSNRAVVLAAPGVLLAALFAAPSAPATAEDPPTTVTIVADRTAMVAGTSVALDISVSDGNNGTLRLTATNAKGSVSGTVADPVNDAQLRQRFSPLVTTTFTASVGDVSDSVTVKVRPLIGTKVLTAHSTIGRYAVMARGASPRFASSSGPSRPGQMCLRHEVQRLRNGVWSTVVVSGCRLQDSKGKVTWQWAGSHPRLVSYRVRATFPGDSLNAPGPGRWTYFRFR